LYDKKKTNEKLIERRHKIKRNTNVKRSNR